LGENLVVGTQTRPNEVTYSEPWMRPDFVPPAVDLPPGVPLAAEGPQPDPASPAPLATDATDGLRGMMVPPGGGP
jgi:phospholipid/cholesterol/gamma-HCH transport system substrate-binding protein